VSRYRLLSDAAADADIEAAFEWYESEQPELGFEFLDEVEPRIIAFSTDHLSTKNFDLASGAP